MHGGIARGRSLRTGPLLRHGGIVTAPECAKPSEVQRVLACDPSVEWIVGANDPRRGESVTFERGIRMLESFNPDEATFYAHAKGVSPRFETVPPEHLVAVRRWRRFMYDRCLGNLPALNRILRRAACCGAMRAMGECHPAPGDFPSGWHFRGTFFWFNHASYFGHPGCRALGANRYAVERHAGTLFSMEQSCCLAAENWPIGKSAYEVTDEEWDQLESSWMETADRNAAA